MERFPVTNPSRQMVIGNRLKFRLKERDNVLLIFADGVFI